MEIKFIQGGVCAPQGFKANGIHCGIRKNKDKKDIALIVSECVASAAAVYTQNLVYGAPITVTKQNIANGKAQAMVCNSGIANTCNADGVEKAQAMCDTVAKNTQIKADDVIVASTGVIGQPLDIEPIENGMPELVKGLNANGSDDAANAIMTTDTRKKEFAVEVNIGGKPCKIGAIAKGSGMIHPNMATMLCFITTDAAISPEMLKKALVLTVADSFNMLSVDGDTSTNDMVSVMANGLAGNETITADGEDFDAFVTALKAIAVKTVRLMARDGEGATKLVECTVSGAATEADAKILAKSVICSSLVKAAMFGSDANWGRVLCALGYAKASVDVGKVGVSFVSKAGSVEVCKNGAGIDFSEEIAKKVLSEEEILIDVTLGDGNGRATAFGCDLTYDYVKINGDYRT